jgi:hypothetical protein
MTTHRGLGLVLGVAACLAGAGGCSASKSNGSQAQDAAGDVTFNDANMDSSTTPGPDSPVEGPDAPGEGSSPDATLDASADSPAEAGMDATDGSSSDGPNDASAEAAATGFYVDPANGLDTNPGTAALPFKTIYHATVAVNGAGADAGAPPTVFLADGTYDSTNQTSFWGSFSKPAFVRGSGAANVILKGRDVGEVLYFAQGGGISGVTFRNTTSSYQVRGGSFTASGVTFDGLPGFNNTAQSFVNGAVATLDSLSFVHMNSAGGQDLGTLLYADNTANVTWNATGTTIVSPATSPGMAIFARGGAQIAIEGLTLTNFPGSVAVLYDQAQLTLTSSTITGSGPVQGICSGQSCASISLGGSQTGIPGAALTLNGTTISGSPAGSAVAYTTTSNTGTVGLTFTNSHLDNNAYAGLWIGGNTGASLAITVTSRGSTFSGNAMSGITTAPKASISVSGGAISNNGTGAVALAQTPGAIVFQDGASASALSLHNVTLASNTGDAITFAGSASSTLDLGTTATAGGNTFSGVTVTNSALHLTALIAAGAVGNTWMPSAQGADSSGHYTSSDTIVGPATGLNVTAPSGASVVMH